MASAGACNCCGGVNYLQALNCVDDSESGLWMLQADANTIPAFFYEDNCYYFDDAPGPLPEEDAIEITPGDVESFDECQSCLDAHGIGCCIIYGELCMADDVQVVTSFSIGGWSPTGDIKNCVGGSSTATCSKLLGQCASWAGSGGATQQTIFFIQKDISGNYVWGMNGNHKAGCDPGWQYSFTADTLVPIAGNFLSGSGSFSATMSVNDGGFTISGGGTATITASWELVGRICCFDGSACRGGDMDENGACVELP